MQQSSGDPTALWVGVVVIVFGSFVFVLWGIDLFDFTGTDASAKIISASIALVGALFGSVISIIGLMLKHSVDQRNADIKEQAEIRFEMESERNGVLAVEAEDRLKLDTAIRAVALLSTSTGNPAPMIQRAGVLFTLTSLKQYELAMALTSKLLAQDEIGIDAYSAALILSQVMKSGDTDMQEQAVQVFGENVEKFLKQDGKSETPPCLFNWEDSLSVYSREWGFIAVARLLASRPSSGWEKYQLFALVSVLGKAWNFEPEEDLKQAMGTVLNSVLPAFPELGTLYHPLQALDMESIRAEVASATTNRGAFIELVTDDLEPWVTAAGSIEFA